MKIFEIASAEDQLALVRVIFDNTWKALEQQAEQQRRSQTKAKQKQKPKSRVVQRAKAGARPIPAFKPIPIASAPIYKSNTDAAPSQTSATLATSAPYPNSSVTQKMGNSVSEPQSLGRSNTVQRKDVDADD